MGTAAQNIIEIGKNRVLAWQIERYSGKLNANE